MKKSKSNKKRKLLDAEEIDDQVRLRLYQLTINEMEHDYKLRSEALRLSRKRKKQVDSWVY